MKLFTQISNYFNKAPIIKNEPKDGNQIIGDLKLINSKIIFEGKNNIFFTPKANTELHDSMIHFQGNNSLVFLGGKGLLNLYIKNDSVFYLGDGNYINKNLDIQVTERKHVIIGNKCLFSKGISLRTSDAHTIYDCETQKRINHGKSVYIGDHVWVGLQALLMKGTRIASGSIVGARSVLSNKIVPSNCSFAGNPAKLVKKGVYFTGACIHAYSVEELAKIENGSLAAKDFIFQHDTRVHLPFAEIDLKLDSIVKPMERIEYLMATLYKNENKNRFAF